MVSPLHDTLPKVIQTQLLFSGLKAWATQRVMIIDNERDYLEFVTELLKEADQAVEVVGVFLDPIKALQELDRCAPDALVDLLAHAIGHRHGRRLVLLGRSNRWPHSDSATCSRQGCRRYRSGFPARWRWKSQESRP